MIKKNASFCASDRSVRTQSHLSGELFCFSWPLAARWVKISPTFQADFTFLKFPVHFVSDTKIVRSTSSHRIRRCRAARFHYNLRVRSIACVFQPVTRCPRISGDKKWGHLESYQSYKKNTAVLVPFIF